MNSGSERDLGHDYIVGIEERLQNQQEIRSKQVGILLMI